jgi:hypothetical protein
VQEAEKMQADNYDERHTGQPQDDVTSHDDHSLG